MKPKPLTRVFFQITFITRYFHSNFAFKTLCEREKERFNCKVAQHNTWHNMVVYLLKIVVVKWPSLAHIMPHNMHNV